MLIARYNYLFHGVWFWLWQNTCACVIVCGVIHSTNTIQLKLLEQITNRHEIVWWKIWNMLFHELHRVTLCCRFWSFFNINLDFNQWNFMFSLFLCSCCCPNFIKRFEKNGICSIVVASNRKPSLSLEMYTRTESKYICSRQLPYVYCSMIKLAKNVCSI